MARRGWLILLVAASVSLFGPVSRAQQVNNPPVEEWLQAQHHADTSCAADLNAEPDCRARLGLPPSPFQRIGRAAITWAAVGVLFALPFVLWRFAHDLRLIRRRRGHLLTFGGRLFVGGCAVWGLGVWFVAETFAADWFVADSGRLWAMLIGPPAIALVAFFLWAWAARARSVVPQMGDD